MSGELDPSAAVFTPMHLEDRQANAIESFRARCIATGSVSDESSLGTIFLFHKRESFLMFKDIVQHPDFSQGVETIVYCPSRFVNRPEHRNWLSHQYALAHNTALLFKPSIYTAQPYQALLDYDGLGEGPRRLASLTMVNVSVPTNLSRAVFEQLKHVRVIESTGNGFTDTGRGIVSPKAYGLSLIRHAKMLESLQLRSNTLLMGDADILLAQRFVNLRYCRISGLRVSSAAALAAFFLAHAETLEYLVLGNIYLAAGVWTTFRMVLKGQMKRLKQVKLNALHQAGYPRPLEKWMTDDIIRAIVSSDSKEQGSPFMGRYKYPDIGPQDDYNRVYYVQGRMVW
ncbi:hypothetical protein VTO58DRAFT_101444 [Aureobasidium pullulans]